jgi:hypothetical protein
MFTVLFIDSVIIIQLLFGRFCIERTAWSVAVDFGTDVVSGERVKPLHSRLLFGNMTGMKNIRQPKMLPVTNATGTTSEQHNESEQPQHNEV